MPRFGDGGVLRGVIGTDLTPEGFAALGVALAGEGKAALGWCGGDGAAMLGRALGSGLAAGGREVLAHDGCCPAAGCWLGEYYGLGASFFVEQEGERAFLHWFGPQGLPPEETRPREDAVRVEARKVGPWERLCGVNTAWAAAAARRDLWGGTAFPLTVAVPGQGGRDQALSDALERMGCRVMRRESSGVSAFWPVHGGFRLEAVDELGRRADWSRLLALVALLELERGEPVAVGAEAPAVLEELGERWGAPVLRLGRDRGARKRCAQQPQLRDALFAAAALAAAMEERRATLGQLLEALPPFSRYSAEVPLEGDRGELMEAFTSRFRRAEPAGTGVRLRAGGGWVTVEPLLRRSAVRLLAEGADMETAQELCGFYEDEIRQLDRREK